MIVMMKVGTVDGVYIRLIWCRLTQDDLRKEPLNKFVVVVNKLAIEQ